MKPTVLVIDDEKTFRIVAEEALTAEGIQVITAPSAHAGLDAWRRDPPDLVILDRNLPDGDGLQVLETLIREGRARNLETLVVMATAYADVSSAVAALKAGAFDYLSKPLQLPELVVTVRKALEASRLRAQVRLLSDRAQAAIGQFVPGESPAMRQVLDMVDKVAQARDTTVLIQGESGTGKELIADLIHRRTPGRSAQSFVAMNCASVPEGLLESALFGHERGAFTDAKTQRHGLFEEADGGTLFLDEVAELQPGTQAKLLRVLEETTFRRLGGTRDLTVSVRLVAATNKDLAAEVNRGVFRLDLYHRLDVFHLRLPPLRERPDDVVPLATAFLGDFRGADGQARGSVRARDRDHFARLRLPRQRARAAQHRRAGGHLVDRRSDRSGLHHARGGSPTTRDAGSVLFGGGGVRRTATAACRSRTRLHRAVAGFHRRQSDAGRAVARGVVPDGREEDRRLRSLEIAVARAADEVQSPGKVEVPLVP